MNTLLDAANKTLRSGLSLIPLLRNGTKAPMSEWKRFQNVAPSQDEVQQWIQQQGAAIGLVTGFAGIGVIDIDCGALIEEYKRRVKEAAPGLIERLLQVETPRPGLHLVFRCPGGVEQSRRLASRRLQGNKVETLIETREIGSYVVFAYSPVDVHPSGISYRVLEGEYCSIPTISLGERQILIDIGRSLDESAAPHQKSALRKKRIEMHPIVQEFNEKTAWTFIQDFGWKYLKSNNGVEFWQKPKSSNGGHHATINFGGYDQLYIFSTSADPFEERCAYTKFEAYCQLQHRGDYFAAINQLQSR